MASHGAEVLTDLAVLVKISGPDPKLAKARARPFHVANSGTSTFSASGFKLPSKDGSPTQILCPANLLEPFLPSEGRARLASASHASLLPGTRIALYMGENASQARLEGFFCVSAVAEVLSRLTHDGGDWAAAWLSSGISSQGGQSLLPWMAVLQYCPAETDPPGSASLSTEQKRPCTCFAKAVLPGTAITAMGSPFGALSHMHFGNHVVTGVTANIIHGQEGSPALLLADMNVLPGMDGGPVTDCNGLFIGTLGMPLCSHTFMAEVPTIIPAGCLFRGLEEWRASNLATPRGMATQINSSGAQHRIQQGVSSRHRLPLHEGEGRSPPWGVRAATSGMRTSTRSQSPASPSLSGVPCHSLDPRSDRQQHCSAAVRDMQHAVAAAQHGVVAISASSGSWASGVVVSAHNGYILTNAHLLMERTEKGRQSSRERMPVETVQTMLPTVNVQIWPKNRGSERGMGGSRQPVWATAAVIYIFQGTLDVAVVQVESSARMHLQQLDLREAERTPTTAAGQPVAVVGFPLFSPRFSLGQIATAGVISKVVCPSLKGERGEKQAAMLMTSAAIYPGASGGAVIGLDGCMIGLVTSNARDSNANKSLPKLNFSILATALQPLWHLLLNSTPISTLDIVKLDVSSEIMSSVWALHPDLTSDKQVPGGAHRLQKLLEDKGILPAGVPGPSGVSVIQSRL